MDLESSSILGTSSVYDCVAASSSPSTRLATDDATAASAGEVALCAVLRRRVLTDGPETAAATDGPETAGSAQGSPTFGM